MVSLNSSGGSVEMRIKEPNKETCKSLLHNLVLIDFIFERTQLHATLNGNKNDSSNRSIQER